MNKAQLEALIQREAEKPPYMRHGYAVDTMATGNFKAGASLLAQPLLEAMDFINSRRCKYYVGIVTPGREVKVHDNLNCKKCQALQRIKELLGGGK